MGGKHSVDQQAAHSDNGSSWCLVRNQMGRDLQVRCAAATLPEDGSMPDLSEALIPHGTERRVEVHPYSVHGLVVVLQLGIREGEGDKAIDVPNESTIFCRAFRGELLVKLLYPSEPESGIWQAPHELLNADNLLRTAQDAVHSAEQSLLQSQSLAQMLSEPAQNAPSESTVENLDPCQTALTIDNLNNTSANHGNPSEDVHGHSEDNLVPLECFCPISHDLFMDPVLASDGFTYERSCLEEWWRRQGPKSPMTGKLLSDATLRANLAARALCDEYRDKVSSNFTSIGVTRPESVVLQQLPMLVDMFNFHLQESEVHSVCESLVARGVDDIDVCVQQLLQRTDSRNQAAAVSLMPVCCAHTGVDEAAAQALLDLSVGVPEHWSANGEQLFGELLDLNFSPIRARKAIEQGLADDLEEAVTWIEKHQEDPDVDTPMEVLLQREIEDVVLLVMLVATIPRQHRMPCYKTLHQILARIFADPDSVRVRKLRIHNPKFRAKVGRFRPAVRLLREGCGFTKGDFWVTAHEREDCLECCVPVGSDSCASQRLTRVFSMLDDLVHSPENWFSLTNAEVNLSAADVNNDMSVVEDAEEAEVACDGFDDAAESWSSEGEDRVPVDNNRKRDFLADLHERRVRDPRSFLAAAQAAGKRPNPMRINVQHGQSGQIEGQQVPQQGAGASQPASSSSSNQQGSNYRRLDERYGGRRHFDLRDVEKMRVDDAIAGMRMYASEYDFQQRQSRTYSDLITRMYDPQYVGRKALDNTNIFRGQQNMPPMKWNQSLAEIAAEHAGQMARGEMPFSHQDFNKRVDRYPFPHMSAAENLAYNGGVSDVAGVAVDGWIKSPGHRRNLLGAFDQSGIGVAKSCTGEFYLTQLFARSTYALC